MRNTRRWACAAALLSFSVGLSGGGATSVSAQDLRIGLGSEPSSIDPLFHNLTPNNATLSHIYERLVEMSHDGKLLPQLAESWSIVNDTTWEFKLRKGVTFHDGSPFTVDDVLFTFERAPNVPNSPSGFGTVTKGKTLKRIDDHTLQISTATAWPLMATELTNLMIVSKKSSTDATTSDYNSGKAAIGTGPFKFGAYVPGDRIEVVRNDAYWGDKSKWAKVIFRPIKTGPARVAALLSGDVDVIEDVPTPDVERLKKDPKIDIAQAITRRVIYFHMDHFRDDSPFIKAKDGSPIKNPLRDKRVRTALSKAINRDAIVSRLMEGSAVPAGQFLNEGFSGTSPNLKPVAYDPEGAKKLLAEAGFPNGFRMTIHGPNGRYTNDVKIAEAVAQMFTRVGIETTVETMPPATFFQRASIGANGLPEFSFILVGWSADTGEVGGSLRPLVGTFNRETGSGATNRGRYSNPELDALIAEAFSTVDEKKRAEILAKGSEVAINDVSIIPSHYPIAVWGLRKGLKMLPRTDEYTLVKGITGQ